MKKDCKKCRRYKHKIACLKCEQEADNNYPIVRPQIIKPLVKNVPLDGLTDKEKIVWMAHTLFEMTDNRISNIKLPHHTTIKSMIKSISEKIRKGKNG